MTSAKNLANKLKALMPAHGFDQAELARRSGIKPNSISRYLAGLNMPRPAQLAKLAAALEVPVGELLAEETPADATDAPNLLCLTQTSASGVVRLQIDQSVPGEVATQIVALLLGLPSGGEAEAAVPCREKKEKEKEAAKPALPRPRTTVGGGLADLFVPRAPQQPEHVRQILRLDGPPQRALNEDTRP
ncbi:MAG: helix-turn-helix domain-containing protein [Burkholderiales bacterium]